MDRHERRAAGSALVLAMLMFVPACDPGAEQQPPTLLEGALPVYPGDTVPSALVQGEVTVVEEGGVRCVGITTGGELNSALWPPGFALKRDPLRIIDNTGRVVAHDGDTLEIGGGHVPAGQFPNPCGTPELIIVGSIE